MNSYYYTLPFNQTSIYLSLISILYVFIRRQSQGGGVSLFRYCYLLKVKLEEVGSDEFGVTFLIEFTVIAAVFCRN